MNGAGLESLYRHGYVAAAREENHRHANAGDVHFPLQLQAIHARHVDVQNNTPGLFAGIAVQELGSRCVGLDGQTDRFNQGAQSVPDRHVVVYKKNGLVRVSSAVARTSRCRYFDALGLLLRHWQLKFKCCTTLGVVRA